MKKRSNYTTSKNKDGSPRKLRKATHPQSIWRQARMIMEHMTGRKSAKGETIHHSDGGLSNRKGNIKRVTKSKHESEHNGHRGEQKRHEKYLYKRGKHK
jgi:hypothetical protein